MTVAILWKNLKELVDFDNAIADVEHEISKVGQEIEQLSAQLPDFEKKQQAHEQACKDAQKIVDRLELESAELTAREKEKKRAIDSVKNQKEYEAVTAELEEITSISGALEDQLIEAWHTLENAQDTTQKYKMSSTQKREGIQKEIEELQQKRSLLQERVEKVRSNRTLAAGAIPPEWLAKYERMRKSVQDPIVSVINGACGSCFYRVLRHDLARIEKNAILPCKSCYRLLYKEEVQETV